MDSVRFGLRVGSGYPSSRESPCRARSASPDIITGSDTEASIGDEVVVEATTVTDWTTGMSWDVFPHPPGRQAIIDAGGLIACTRKKMLEARAKG